MAVRVYVAWCRLLMMSRWDGDTRELAARRLYSGVWGSIPAVLLPTLAMVCLLSSRCVRLRPLPVCCYTPLRGGSAVTCFH